MKASKKDDELKQIAYTSDEVLNMFRDTPIFTLLLERRVAARTLLETNPDSRDERILEKYNEDIKKFFLV